MMFRLTVESWSTLLKRLVNSTTLGERTCFIGRVHCPGFNSLREINEKIDQSIRVSCLAKVSGVILVNSRNSEIQV